MAYIGKQGISSTTLTSKTLSTMVGNGSTDTLTLSSTPTSVNDVAIYLDGIFQRPTTEYTLSGSTITFTTAPANNVFVCAVVGGGEHIGTPMDDSIGTDKLVDGTVTNAKIDSVSTSKVSGTLPALNANAVTGLNAANLVGSAMPAIDGSNLTGISSFTKNANDPAGNTNPAGGVGTIWANTTSGELYVLTDATTDANVWTNVGNGTGPIPNPISAATGGTVTTAGDYKIHTFTSSDNFVVTNNLSNFEYLMVAGGGGGGSGYSNSSYAAGGGGGGGMITGSISVNNGTFPIVVGAGGVGQAEDTQKTYSGTDSLFSTLIATGGGGGGPRSANNSADFGQAGGSGGGAGPGLSPGYPHSFLGGIAISNKIPTMTSNTAPYGTAFASENGNTGDSSACWKAFDNNNNTSWTTTSTGTSFAGVDLGFNFTTGFAATGYTLTLKDADANQAPKDWTFQGSNDGTNWTTLDTQADWNLSNATGDWQGYGAQKITWTFSNTTSYTRYKWVFTGSQSSGQEVFITRAQIFTTGGQGNDGGDGGVDLGGGGGGGGAGAAGTDGTAEGGTGGDGAASSISGSSVTYAGGGGGGAGSSSSGQAAGGTGGGGTGSSKSASDATAGTVNTGGGGGGAGTGFSSAAGASASGGSGIVIIKYKYQ